VLRFCRAEGDGYKVYFDGVGVGRFSVPDDLRVNVGRLGFADLDGFGVRLSEALFDACPSLVELVRGLRGQSVRFVLEFGDGAEDLLNFPWAFLRHPDFAVPLSLEFSFVSRIGEGVELESLRGRPLKVLVVICEPITLVEFDGRRFHEVIVKEAKRLAEEGLLQLEFLQLPSTPAFFGRRILEDCLDIVHFIGHGNVGVLCFEDEDGDVFEVGSERFYSLFSGARKPRLVILTACFSGAVAGRDFVSGTATALVQAGIPSVFAMQLPIGIESAYELVGDLYAGLLSMPFDELVKSLRATRFFAERLFAPAQWGIPVLYSQSRIERLFDGVSKGEGFVKEWLPVSPAYGLPELGLFVGRKKHLLQTSWTLRGGNIVVLDGLSGIGKSALARKFCHWHRSRGSFQGGIVWIDLRAGEEVKWDYETVLEKIGVALNVPIQRAREALGLKPTLLVFDSYEGLVKDEKLADFLINLPGSSKAILTTFLPVDFGEKRRILEMEEKDAVEYFWLRALRAGWDGKAGREYIPEICAELGYMPLCIELTAPRARKLPLGDLLTQVKEDLRVVAAERPDLPKHQRSIETALRLSYMSLGPSEQRLLAVMSILSGRVFSMILARIADLSESDTLRLLGNLYDSGLVNFDGQRYYLHRMVQRFASERLEKDFKEKEKYEERFAEIFYELGGWAAEVLDRGETPRAAVNVALSEGSNFLLAQEVLFKKGDLDKAFSFSMWVEDLFDRTGLWQSRTKVAQLALEIAKQRENREDIVEAYSRLGIAYRQTGQVSKGLGHHQEALQLAKEINFKLGMANQLGNIGIVLRQMGQPKEALENFRKALELHSELGNKLGMANQLGNIGNVLLEMGQPKEALENFQKAKDIFTQIEAYAYLEKIDRLILITKEEKNKRTKT